MFCAGHEVESWSRFWNYVWSMIWVLSFGEMLMFGWDFEENALSRFWRWSLIKICVWTCDMTQLVTLERWTQPSGPLCLWQCLFCILRRLMSWPIIKTYLWRSQASDWSERDKTVHLAPRCLMQPTNTQWICKYAERTFLHFQPILLEFISFLSKQQCASFLRLSLRLGFSNC